MSNPTDLGDYNLPPIDSIKEIALATQALSSIEVTTLTYTQGKTCVDLNNIIKTLRDGVDLLYLVCHGRYIDHDTYLWLEQKNGQHQRVSGEEFAQQIENLAYPPKLIVLAVCDSAGNGTDEAFKALGPRLIRAGVKAVVAMHGNLLMEMSAKMMPTLFKELLRDGRISRAMAIARAQVQTFDWWVPVLFMQSKADQLWINDSKRRFNFLTPYPLIGRGVDCCQVRKLLQNDDVRLVTLTGAPGVGKTSLAKKVAWSLANTFNKGAFVSLVNITDHDFVVQEIAKAFGITDPGEKSWIEAMKSCLSKKRILLFLDNFEHVVEAKFMIVDLLNILPELKILTTSRVSLGVSCEHEFPVLPLETPSLHQLTLQLMLQQDRKLIELISTSAVSLFIAEAKKVQPAFSLTVDNAELVTRICNRLEGLPLAITLAAARLQGCDEVVSSGFRQGGYTEGGTGSGRNGGQDDNHRQGESPS